MSNPKDRFLLVGVDDGSHQWVLSNLESRVKQAGFEEYKLHSHPKTSAADLHRALTNEDMNRKKASWLREVPTRILESVLNATDHPANMIWGYSVVVPQNFDRLSQMDDELPNLSTVETVILDAGLANPVQSPDMEYQRNPPKNPDAPFSYDPAQDYYTEP